MVNSLPASPATRNLIPKRRPLGRLPERTNDPARPFMPQRVQRGGSFLCNDSYCSRYRPSARHGCSPDTGMSHVGFRCVMTQESWEQRRKSAR